MLEPEHTRDAWSVIMLVTRQTLYNRSFKLQPVEACSSNELVWGFPRYSNYITGNEVILPNEILLLLTFSICHLIIGHVNFDLRW
jgi:hypothetical protein